MEMREASRRVNPLLMAAAAVSLLFLPNRVIVCCGLSAGSTNQNHAVRR